MIQKLIDGYFDLLINFPQKKATEGDLKEKILKRKGSEKRRDQKRNIQIGETENGKP